MTLLQDIEELDDSATIKQLVSICKRQQAQLEAVQLTLATFISWQVRELGEAGVEQLLKMLEEPS